MTNFRIDLKRGRSHSVSIQSTSLGSPHVDLSLSAQAAYDLLQALLDNEAEIHEMAYNYYDCSDCGETHRKGETCAPGEDEENDSPEWSRITPQFEQSGDYSGEFEEDNEA